MSHLGLILRGYNGMIARMIARGNGKKKKKKTFLCVRGANKLQERSLFINT